MARRRRKPQRNARYGALFVMLVALAVIITGLEAEALWLWPLITRLQYGR